MRLRTLSASALALALAGLALCGCGNPASADAKRALPLATVNGVDISVVVPPDVKLAPGDRLALVDQPQLEALIDNQLLQEEAVRNKLDRNALVLQAIERARTDILAQAQLQTRFAPLAAPTQAEIGAYFLAHPELFSKRKLFYIKQLVLDSKDFTPQLKQQIKRAATIEQVARWLDARRVRYERTQLVRNSAELAPELLAQLTTMRKHQLFVVKAGPQTMLDALQDVTPNPVTARAAAPEIALFLRNIERKQMAELEIKRLRKLAKIDYVNQQQSSAALAPAASLSNHKEQQ
jgi:EpsD family peptidyl-prolyl cis-trans isomerase